MKRRSFLGFMLAAPVVVKAAIATDASAQPRRLGSKGGPGIVGVHGPWVRGPDAFGTFAQRVNYDDRPPDYAFLQTDVTPFRLWVKASNATADWLGTAC